MTKENRERTYKHFRDLEKNYVAAPGRDHDLEKEDVLKGRAKVSADEMLKKHPELAELNIVEEPTPVKETKSKKKNNGKE